MMNTKNKKKEIKKEVKNILYTNKNIGFSISIPDTWTEVKKSSYGDLGINDNTLFIFVVNKFTSLTAVFSGFAQTKSFNKFFNNFDCNDKFKVIYKEENEINKINVKQLVVETDTNKIMHNFCLINGMIINFTINVDTKNKIFDKKSIVNDINFKEMNQILNTLKVFEPINPPVLIDDQKEENEFVVELIDKVVDVKQEKSLAQILVETDCQYKRILIPNLYLKYSYTKDKQNTNLNIINNEIYFKGLKDNFKLIKVDESVSSEIERIIHNNINELLKMNINNKTTSKSTLLVKLDSKYSYIDLNNTDNDNSKINDMIKSIINELKEHGGIDLNNQILLPVVNKKKEKEEEFVVELIDKVDNEDDFEVEIIDSVKEKDDFEVEIIDSVKDKDDFEVEIIDSVEEKDDFEVEIIDSVEEKDDFEVEIIDSVEEKDDFEVEIIDSIEEKDDFEVEIIDSVEEKDDFEVELIDSVKDKDDSKVEIIDSVEEKDDFEVELIDTPNTVENNIDIPEINNEQENHEEVPNSVVVPFVATLEEEPQPNELDVPNVTEEVKNEQPIQYNMEDFQEYFHNVDGHASFRFVFPANIGEKVIRDFNVFDIVNYDHLIYRVFLFKCETEEKYQIKLRDWMNKNVESNKTNLKETYTTTSNHGLLINTYILENGKFYKVVYVYGYLIAISGYSDDASLTFADIALDNVEIGEDSRAFVEAHDRKMRSINILQAQGIPYIDELPVIKSSYEVTGKTLDEIAKRAIVLCICCNFASDLVSNKKKRYIKESKKFFNKLLETYNVKDVMTKDEKLLFDKMDKNVAIQISWQFESYVILLWTLGLIDDVVFPDTLVEPDSVTAIVSACDTYREFLNKCQLRSTEEVLDLADLTYRYNWYCVESKINGVESVMNPEIVMERHRAFSWLLTEEKWDKVEINT